MDTRSWEDMARQRKRREVLHQIYQSLSGRGIAAVPLNQHGHPAYSRDADGVPLCPMGLRMSPTFQLDHTYGYRAQRFRCPLLFPQPNGQTCEHEQFAKGKGCVKDVGLGTWRAGAHHPESRQSALQGRLHPTHQLRTHQQPGQRTRHRTTESAQWTLYGESQYLNLFNY